MTMTDPIADMLTRIRNANVAMHDEVRMPSSKQKEALAAVLKTEGYIDAFRVEDNSDRPGSTLHITMRYSPERARTISGIQRVSKPGRRVYASVKNLPRVANGLGISILSTPKGVMADHDARDNNVGGEILCRVF